MDAAKTDYMILKRIACSFRVADGTGMMTWLLGLMWRIWSWLLLDTICQQNIYTSRQCHPGLQYRLQPALTCKLGLCTEYAEGRMTTMMLTPHSESDPDSELRAVL